MCILHSPLGRPYLKLQLLNEYIMFTTGFFKYVLSIILNPIFGELVAYYVCNILLAVLVCNCTLICVFLSGTTTQQLGLCVQRLLDDWETFWLHRDCNLRLFILRLAVWFGCVSHDKRSNFTVLDSFSWC